MLRLRFSPGCPLEVASLFQGILRRCAAIQVLLVGLTGSDIFGCRHCGCFRGSKALCKNPGAWCNSFSFPHFHFNLSTDNRQPTIFKTFYFSVHVIVFFYYFSVTRCTKYKKHRKYKGKCRQPTCQLICQPSQPRQSRRPVSIASGCRCMEGLLTA